ELAPRYVADSTQRDALITEAGSLPGLTVSSAAAANAVMLGAGYFNPLAGFMHKDDALSVGATLRTTSGLFWPVPVLNLIEDPAALSGADRIALRDPNVAGEPILAIQHVEGIDEFGADELETLAEQVFGTTDRDHPGGGTFLSQGGFAVHGPIQVLNFSYFETDFPD
ncbi:unnamed protein product, partial [Chrysoparadoxa australica]